jgi:beta-galactosidase
VRVDYKAPSARWYTGAGIYRDVFLIVKDACHFVPDGIYISTFQQDGRWRYEASAQVETGGRPYTVRHTLLGEENGIIPWDIDHPRLYTLRSELIVDGYVTDTEDTRIGFRSIAFTPDRGFLLNGRPLKLKGVCLHGDLGALGGAVHRDALRRQLTLMQEMGANAIRTAHNPPAKSLMELADEMGLLVMSELLDVWRRPKNTYDYARFFDEWVERDAAAWVRRDRNHPSLILWSVGNEIQDTHLDFEDGAKTLQRLMALVKEHDPRGNAAITFCSNYMPWENTQKCAELIKLAGYNYGEKLYEDHHKAHPDWIIYGGETCSTVQSRGVYHFPLSKSVLADDDLQCSSLGNSTTSWGAKSVETCILDDLHTPWSLGQFIWAGQDYLGEPTPYHTKNAYLGHVDTAGFPKDSYYLFQAGWTDCKTAPMVHLYPYWDFSSGQMVDVRVCSNAPYVELFQDGQSLGRQSLLGRLTANWRIPYRPGVLKAMAYDEAGALLCQAERRSFSEAVSLHIQDDVYGELHFFTITAQDAQGNPVENANRRVYVSVNGGTLLGLDNGDATDFEQYQTDNRRMFSGKLLAIVRAEPEKAPQIAARFCEQDIPARKIELVKTGWEVTARLFPKEASFNDLAWRVTDAGGIDSPLAGFEVSKDGKSVTLLPKGDGQAFVRCSVKNGRNHAAFISALAFTITGYGRPFLDPYGFVSGGLYNDSNVELTNGNERGVATLRDGESHVGFRDLDFGDYGSDEITLPLFPLGKEPFTFEVWEGMPLSGGVKICDLSYDLGSVWNTYQEVTYKLPRRLKGVTTLCLVFRQKVHIKGFRFTKVEKAFQRLLASDCDTVYGDSYKATDDGIEGIGNNVTLVFERMDFGADGASQVALCWRSTCDKNAIQFVFEGEGGQIRKMVVVGQAGEYTSGVFPLGEAVAGMNTVSLVFLPGCDLDLRWIQFMP